MAPSNLSALLQHTRIAQVPPTTAPLTAGRELIYPTHQIIENKPSTLYRQEWGMKAAIPSKIKSRFLIYNQLDTMERITTFEPRGGEQWNRIRFQEIGVPLGVPMGKVNPLFDRKSLKSDGLLELSSILKKYNKNKNNIDNLIDIHSNSNGKRDLPLKKKDLKNSIKQMKEFRKIFKKWLLKKYPESLKLHPISAKTQEQHATEFLHEILNDSSRDSLTSKNSNNIIGSGGLSYNLKGRLRNSPNGIIQKNIVPGRLVNTASIRNSTAKAAIGGFISTLTNNLTPAQQNDYIMGDFIRLLPYPFKIQEASMNDQGALSLKVEVLAKRVQKDWNHIESKPLQRISKGIRPVLISKGRPSSSYPSSQDVTDLLDILKS